MSQLTIMNLASEKQVSFINSLLATRLVSDDLLSRIGNVAELDRAKASSLIEHLLGLPTKSVPELAVGMYLKDGEIYKVKRSEESGRLYASILVNGKFQYAQGALRGLLPEHRMTLEQAKAYGVQYGICCVCGRLLTNEVSVTEGIGPVCAGRL